LETLVNVQEVRKLDAYLKRLFGNPKIRVVPRPKKDDSAEVYIGEEFIGVLIGAGAMILGNSDIGHCARIAAGSVVVKPVPHNVTVAGVPATVVGEAGCAEPSRTMDQMLHATNGL
jgi:serine acetyltransferase